MWAQANEGKERAAKEGHGRGEGAGRGGKRSASAWNETSEGCGQEAWKRKGGKGSAYARKGGKGMA